jgi:uncharacterized protein YkwD
MGRASGAICSLVFLLSLWHAGSAFSADQATGKKVIDLVNRVRAKGAHCGTIYYGATSPVQWNDTLAKVSFAHSRDMAEKGFLRHTGSDRKGPGDRLSRFGYIWSAYGENVAEGYYAPEEVVKGWLKSRDHCENIMNPSFKEAGSALARGPRGVYWTLLLAVPGKMTSLDP